MSAVLLLACSNGAGLGAKPPTKKSPTKKTEQQTPEGPPAGRQENGDAQEEVEEDEDLRVIPPEIVSGGYLTCSASFGDAGAPDQPLSFGCSARVGEQKADLKGFLKDWGVFDAVTQERVEAPETPPLEGEADIAWSLSQELYNKGVFARLLLKGAENTEAKLESKHPSIINGMASYD